MHEHEEILDLVDADNRVVGTVTRGDMVKMNYRNPKGYVRFVAAFLVNKEGRVWVPVRGLHKSIAPGGYDFSVAEHVLSGETNEEAIVRGFLDEAGLRIDKESLVFLGSLPPTEDKPVFDEVYALCNYEGGDPDYSREEFSSGEWLMPADLEERLKIKPSKTSLLPALGLLACLNE